MAGRSELYELVGVPFDVSIKDIRKFFRNPNIPEDDISIFRSLDSSCIGSAFVRFNSHFEAKSAKERSSNQIHGLPVSLRKSSTEEMITTKRLMKDTAREDPTRRFVSSQLSARLEDFVSVASDVTDYNHYGNRSRHVVADNDHYRLQHSSRSRSRSPHSVLSAHRVAEQHRLSKMEALSSAREEGYHRYSRSNERSFHRGDQRGRSLRNYLSEDPIPRAREEGRGREKGRVISSHFERERGNSTSYSSREDGSFGHVKLYSVKVMGYPSDFTYSDIRRVLGNNREILHNNIELDVTANRPTAYVSIRDQSIYRDMLQRDGLQIDNSHTLTVLPVGGREGDNGSHEDLRNYVEEQRLRRHQTTLSRSEEEDHPRKDQGRRRYQQDERRPTYLRDVHSPKHYAYNERPGCYSNRKSPVYSHRRRSHKERMPSSHSHSQSESTITFGNWEDDVLSYNTSSRDYGLHDEKVEHQERVRKCFSPNIVHHAKEEPKFDTYNDLDHNDLLPLPLNSMPHPSNPQELYKPQHQVNSGIQQPDSQPFMTHTLTHPLGLEDYKAGPIGGTEDYLEPQSVELQHRFPEDLELKEFPQTSQGIWNNEADTNQWPPRLSEPPNHSLHSPWVPLGSEEEYGERSQEEYGERSHKEYGEKSQEGYGERSQEEYGERSHKEYGEKSQEGYGEKSHKEYGEKSQEEYGERSQEGYGERSQEEYGERSEEEYGERSEEEYGEKSEEEPGTEGVASDPTLDFIPLNMSDENLSSVQSPAKSGQLRNVIQSFRNRQDPPMSTATNYTLFSSIDQVSDENMEVSKKRILHKSLNSSSEDEASVLRLSNLPKEAKIKDILAYLRCSELQYDDVRIQCDDTGRPTGRAFINFKCKEQARGTVERCTGLPMEGSHIVLDILC